MELPVELGPCLPDQLPAAQLLDEMVAEMRELYGILGAVVGVPLEPSELAPPAGVYLVARAGAEVVAGGGLRLVTPEMAEIKRMYVRPQYRGRGVARVLLSALETEALRLGAHIARLDTGPQQPHALGLYRRSGYVEIDDWNQNPHATYWGEKRLA